MASYHDLMIDKQPEKIFFFEESRARLTMPGASHLPLLLPLSGKGPFNGTGYPERYLKQANKLFFQ